MRQSVARAYKTEEMGITNKTLAVKPLEVVKHVYDACDDAKGKDIVILDVSKNFGLADYFLIASARSDRHTQGLANKVIEELKKIGLEPFSVQGMEDGKWVIVDCVEVVLHIFYEPLRSRYDLESLWTNAETLERRSIPKKIKAMRKEAHLVPA